MIDINIPNIITIGLIAFLAISLAKVVKNMGVPLPI